MKVKGSALVPASLFTKTNDTLDSVARNTSCSRGWLHLVVQVTFGTITVASFILIMLMNFQWLPKSPCSTVSCRVTCLGPYDESDIVAAVMAADSDCSVKLTLKYPIFENGIMPANWLDDVSHYIETLSIVGGNLNEIANNAFMAQFANTLKTLLLENITITSWTSNTFIGLAELNFLRIVSCKLIDIKQDALRAVDSRINTLTITGSGAWNPRRVTGSGAHTLQKLNVVNFSFNNFGNIIDASSFTGLENCKDLYLNSCGITSIAAGAFDSLKSIDMLFLNDNFLVTIAPGLFDSILHIQSHPPPRINLQNNYWLCDCTQNDILRLSYNGLLLVDPTCYHPEVLSGKPISGLEEFCRNKNETLRKKKYVNVQATVVDYELKPECVYGTEVIGNMSFQLISPSPIFECPSNSVRNFNWSLRSTLNYSMVNNNSNDSWLRPEFLLRHDSFSMMQVGATTNNSYGYGLLWYQSLCPNELYCFNILPKVLRIYNVNKKAKYTFCPLDLLNAEIKTDQCIFYDMSDAPDDDPTRYIQFSRPVLYAATGMISLVLGAVLVYGVIRMNPWLLKGSKRLLFVKHRSVDALVLPPKIPLRTSLSKEVLASGDNQIYTVTHNTKLLPPCILVRSDSIRSDKSSSPTYVSALQPTEAQLAEWRLRHHFDKNVSITSITSENSTYYWDVDINATCTNVPYEIFK